MRSAIGPLLLLFASAGCIPGWPVEVEVDSWNRGILATTFWVGEKGNGASAWDPQWVKSFGGVDDPEKRNGFLPASFTPKQNPFYCALPFNDVARKPGAKSALKDYWVEVRANGKSCFCQLEDAGPFYTDDGDYVLGGQRPRAEKDGKAGIDLSPAVRDYLGLSGKDLVDWQFVADSVVPTGPWKNWGKTATSGGSSTYPRGRR